MSDERTTGSDDTAAVLAEWTARLSAELGVADLETDIDDILRVAGIAAHSIVRPAAPLTTFLVGYAAGRATAEGRLSAESAVAAASTSAVDLARGNTERPPSSDRVADAPGSATDGVQLIDPTE